MRYEIRPRSTWTDPVTPIRRGAHVFRAAWPQTLNELADEVERISKEADPVVVVEIDVVEGDLRRDGMLRANAKVGAPGVVVSFESKFGPLRLATDAYEQEYRNYGLEGWQANVRAVMLTLRALRDLDRWGVSRRGEQYTGWKALPPGTGKTVSASFGDVWAAADWMRQYATGTLRLDFAETRTPNGKSGDWRDLYKAMARKMHPDQPGATRADWDRLDEAKRLLEAEGWI
jgi:hypothetical protein